MLHPLFADAYTISSDFFASEDAKDYSCYSLTNRKSPSTAFQSVAKDCRMVMYGLNDYINKYLINPVTKEDVKRASLFMNRACSFGGGLPFNSDMWNTIVNDFEGRLPLEISSPFRDGDTFTINQPYIHVKSTVKGFGELAAHIEARLVGMIANGTATATLCRHWLERMREEVKKDLDLLGRKYTTDDIDMIAQWQIHNFGSRACFTGEESIVSGKAHLLSFNGTDNFDAAFEAWEEGCKEDSSNSILALAHRNIQGYEQSGGEIRCFEEIIKLARKYGKAASMVADCYNYNNAVSTIVDLAMKNKDVMCIPRPDSGSCYDTIETIFNICKNKGCYKTENGYLLPDNVKYIYGDSVKPEQQFKVMADLRNKGILPTLWGCWGSGGYIRNTPNRDSLSSAYKLCEYGNEYPSVKLSESMGKMSIPYQTTILNNRVVRYNDNYPINIYYTNGIKNINENFSVIQNRAIKSFDSFVTEDSGYYINREHLDKELFDIQENTFNKYRGAEI